MPLNPDIEAYLDLVEMGRMSGKVRPMHELDPNQAREDFDMASLIMAGEGEEQVDIEDKIYLTRDAKELRMRFYTPNKANESSRRPTLIYFHGGGYVVGSLESHDALCCKLADSSGHLVVSVEYRLAPEYKFPTPIHDAVDAVNTIASCSEAFGIDSNAVAFGGDSVGGSIATVLSILASKQVDKVHLQPYMQMLFYPVTDPGAKYPSLTDYSEGYLLETKTLDWFYEHYVSSDSNWKDWRFSPMKAEDICDVAPLVLVLPEFDPLVDEGKKYANKLKENGIDVEMLIYEGMTHDFLRMSALVEEVPSIINSLALKLSEYLDVKLAP